jgi:hypothetical protein
LSIPEALNDRGRCIRPQGAGIDIGAHEFTGNTSQTAPTSSRSKAEGQSKAGGGSSSHQNYFGLPKASGSPAWRIPNVR